MPMEPVVGVLDAEDDEQGSDALAVLIGKGNGFRSGLSCCWLAAVLQANCNSSTPEA
jgi:hypothetical protein